MKVKVRVKARGSRPGKGLALLELWAHVSKVQFEWDAAKAASNLAKHGVTFDQGSRVFTDPAHVTVADTRHTTEVRENATGLVAGVILLTVTHTNRAGVTRLISARRASRKERNTYHAAH